MARFKLTLIGLLVFQLVIGAGLFWNQQAGQHTVPQGSLLSMSAARVDRLVVKDNEGREVTLRKSDAAWQLENLFALPADLNKVEPLLSKLENLKQDWPVTTTEESHDRFEVSDEVFQRHLRAFEGDQAVADIYLGTSPGFRSVHVRRSGDDAVYAVSLNTFDLPVEPSDWLDQSLLSMKDISWIEGPDYRLQKEDESWQLSAKDVSHADNRAANPDAADQLSKALRNLRVTAVHEHLPDAKEVAKIPLTVGSGETLWQYEFIQSGDQFFVRRNDLAQLFAMSPATYEKISKANLDALSAAEERAAD